MDAPPRRDFRAGARRCRRPWVAFNLATVGSPLPATAAAKIEGGLVGALAGQRESLVSSVVTRPGQYLIEWVNGWAA